MAGLRRSYAQPPGLATLGNIESVNVVSVTPPAVASLGDGTAIVAVVGEFERGPLATPTQIFGGSDMDQTFGGFGHIKSGTRYSYPVAQRSGGSSKPWAGSGFVALRNLPFTGLVVVRVDNSAGSVSFSPKAFVLGTGGVLNLEPSDAVSFAADGGGAVTGTYTGVAAGITGVAGTYPTNFVGGETLELELDDGAAVLLTFPVTVQTVTQVVAFISSRMAATCAIESAGELRVQSVIRGWGGRIKITGGTARATLGLPTAATAQVFTGTITGAAQALGVWTSSIVRTVLGVATTYTASFTADGTPTPTEVGVGLVAAWTALAVPGMTFVSTGAGTFTGTLAVNEIATSPVITPPGADTATWTQTAAGLRTNAIGTGNVRDIDRVQASERVTVINALAGISSDLDPDGYVRVWSDTALTGTLAVTACSAAIGFTVAAAVTAAPSVDVTIPAGTLVSDSSTAGKWITLEDVVNEAGNLAALTAKVRPAVDTDATPSSIAGAITTIDDTLYEVYSVTNAAAVVRLSSYAMDTRYLEAIASTIDTQGVSYSISQIVSARSTGLINNALSNNVLAATTSGHEARKTVISPPVGATRTEAKSDTALGVGVGANRSERVLYRYPAVTMMIPEIMAVGPVLGGVGFTLDGVVEVTSNLFYASIRSVLPPEENGGQQLSDTAYGPPAPLFVEDQFNRELSSSAVGLTIDDYISFKAYGIGAPRYDRVAKMVFQTDCTSVDPSVDPGLADAKRIYMSDAINNALSDIGVKYAKKLGTENRVRALITTITSLLSGLRSLDLPESSRINDFRVVNETTPTLRAQGHVILAIGVQLTPSMDLITFNTEIGTTVVITTS